MALETFTYQRQKGATGKTTYRVREVQFGEGYSQAVQDGMNNEVQVWPLTFEGGLAYITEIKSFFDRHHGYKSFYWTPPGAGGPLLFRVTEVSITSINGGVYSLSAEFKQVFQL